MLKCVKSKDLFRMGGGADPQGLIIPKDMIKRMARNTGFALGVALKPDHSLTNDEVTHMEGYFLPKGSNQQNMRDVDGPMVVWLPKDDKGEGLWKVKGRKDVVHGDKTFILGGSCTFWPLPLQRDGPCSSMMWEATFPEGVTSEWLDLMGKALSKELRGCLWTISRRYD